MSALDEARERLKNTQVFGNQYGGDSSELQDTTKTSGKEKSPDKESDNRQHTVMRDNAETESNAEVEEIKENEDVLDDEEVDGEETEDKVTDDDAWMEGIDPEELAEMERENIEMLKMQEMSQRESSPEERAKLIQIFDNLPSATIKREKGPGKPASEPAPKSIITDFADMQNNVHKESESEEFDKFDPENPDPALGKIKKRTQSDEITTLLWEGHTKEEIETLGYNRNSIRTIASNMKKEHNREFGKPSTGGTSAVQRKSPVQLSAKGASPEAIVESLQIPEGFPMLSHFDDGMKFGMQTIIVGVRLAQELSAIGTAQAVPLIKIASEMRAGEQAAAENAAGAAATDAVNQMMQQVGPTLSSLEGRMDDRSETTKSSTGHPMKPMMDRMMGRVMEPMMNKMVDKMFPGTSDAMKQDLPDSWSRSKD